MTPPIIRLGLRHKRLLYAVFALLWTSGALWLVFHYFLQSPSDFGSRPHPLENWWLRLHGLAAMLALVAFGSVATNHMRLAWGRRRNLASGLAMLGYLISLAATGYALYYFSSDDNAVWLPLLHWVAGLVLPAGLAFHVLSGRQCPPRKQIRPHRAPVLRVVGAEPLPTNASRKASRKASP